MSTTERRTALASALLPVLLALGACSIDVGSDPEYDAEKVAQDIHDAQVKETPDFDVSDGVCPDEAELKEDVEIECTIEIEGVEAPYSVTFTSVDDDGVEYHIEPAQAIISTAKAEEALQANAVEQGLGEVEVDCGGPVLVQEPGSTFVCTLSQGQATQDVTLKVEDTEGNVTVQE